MLATCEAPQQYVPSWEDCQSAPWNSSYTLARVRTLLLSIGTHMRRTSVQSTVIDWVDCIFTWLRVYFRIWIYNMHAKGVSGSLSAVVVLRTISREYTLWANLFAILWTKFLTIALVHGLPSKPLTQSLYPPLIELHSELEAQNPSINWKMVCKKHCHLPFLEVHSGH